MGADNRRNLCASGIEGHGDLEQAFAGCKNLKSIIIRTPYLTKKSVGAKAFKGISSKAVIKVPKKQLKAYKKLLKTKGVAKSVKIK